jgi:hypothetical protein
LLAKTLFYLNLVIELWYIFSCIFFLSYVSTLHYQLDLCDNEELN